MFAVLQWSQNRQNRIITRCFAQAGMSSAATAALYYASAVGDVPVIMAAEPDDLTIMTGK